MEVTILPAHGARFAEVVCPPPHEGSSSSGGGRDVGGGNSTSSGSGSGSSSWGIGHAPHPYHVLLPLSPGSQQQQPLHAQLAAGQPVLLAVQASWQGRAALGVLSQSTLLTGAQPAAGGTPAALRARNEAAHPPICCSSPSLLTASITTRTWYQSTTAPPLVLRLQALPRSWISPCTRAPQQSGSATPPRLPHPTPLLLLPLLLLLLLLSPRPSLEGLLQAWTPASQVAAGAACTWVRVAVQSLHWEQHWQDTNIQQLQRLDSAPHALDKLALLISTGRGAPHPPGHAAPPLLPLLLLSRRARRAP